MMMMMSFIVLAETKNSLTPYTLINQTKGRGLLSQDVLKTHTAPRHKVVASSGRV
jgi:hypothetical protein